MITVEEFCKNLLEPEKIQSHKDSERIKKSSKYVKSLSKNNIPVYGITTGFGEMSNKLIPGKFSRILQENLVRSHSAGWGKEFSKTEVLAIAYARLLSLSKGYSGVREIVVDTLEEMCRKVVLPKIYEQGSLGASGDLAPLSHLALGIMGEGLCIHGLPMSVCMKNNGINPVKLEGREGLGIINGTSASTGIAAMAIHDSKQILRLSLVAQGILLNVLRASTKPFDPEGNSIKLHDGQELIAREMKSLLEGGKLLREHREIVRNLKNQYSDDVVEATEYIQNAYSLRVIPQVVGGVYELLRFSERLITEELNSVNDNPIILGDDEIFHGGNFHGQYVAFASDIGSIAMTQLSVLLERQINRIINVRLNEGLPEFLVSGGRPGLECGFEGGQYIATSVVAENRVMAVPASIQSIPSNEDNQDVVSMSLLAARKFRDITRNTLTVVSVLLMAALKGMDLRGITRHDLGLRLSSMYDYYKLDLVPRYDDSKIFRNCLADTIALLSENMKLVIPPW